MIIVDKNCNNCKKAIKVPKNKTAYGAKYFYCSNECRKNKYREKQKYSMGIEIKIYETKQLAKKHYEE